MSEKAIAILREAGVNYTHDERSAAALGFTGFNYEAKHLDSQPVPRVVFCRSRNEASILVSHWNEYYFTGSSPWQYRLV